MGNPEYRLLVYRPAVHCTFSTIDHSSRDSAKGLDYSTEGSFYFNGGSSHKDRVISKQGMIDWVCSGYHPNARKSPVEVLIYELSS